MAQHVTQAPQPSPDLPAASYHPAAVLGNDELVGALRRGDDEAYESLVRLEGGKLLSVARRILRRDEEEARDVVQDAFLNVFQHIDSFNGQCRLSTWLYRVTVNSALMRLRSRRRRQEEGIADLLPRFYEDGHREIAADEGELPEAEASIQRWQVQEAVRSAIERLPDSYRTVLLLRDLDDLSTAETAELLGITTTAVKLRLHRARQALRQLLILRRSELC